MIDYDTIVSTFDDKLTLLQWLKKLEKVIDNDLLSDIQFTYNDNILTLTLSFKDGTTKTASVQIESGSGSETKLYKHVLHIDGSNMGSNHIDIYVTWLSSNGEKVTNISQLPLHYLDVLGGKSFNIDGTIFGGYLLPDSQYITYVLVGDFGGAGQYLNSNVDKSIFEGEYASYTFTDEVDEII